MTGGHVGRDAYRGVRWQMGSGRGPRGSGQSWTCAGAVTGHGNRAVVPGSSPAWREGLGSQRHRGPSHGQCALEEQGQGL